MRDHVINVQVRVQGADTLTNADVLEDLRRCLGSIQEPQPYRNPETPSWWIASIDAINYENVGEMLQYEADMRARSGEPESQRIGSDPCPNCGGVGSAHVAACDPDWG